MDSRKYRHEVLKVCVTCACELAPSSSWYCQDCLDKMNERCKLRWKNMSDEKKAEIYAAKREKYQRRKEEGKCPRCGKQAEDGKIGCKECNSKEAARGVERRRTRRED